MRWLVVVSGVLLAFVAAAPAEAQESDDGEEDVAADDAASEDDEDLRDSPDRTPLEAEASLASGAGIEAARRGDWSAARDYFARAYGVVPAPLTLYNLAVAEVRSGALLEADAHFEQFLSETSSDTHAAFHREAHRFQELLQEETPSVTLTVDELRDEDRFEIGTEGDSEPISVSSAQLGERVPVNPGDHLARWFHGERLLVSQAFTAASRETIQLSLSRPEDPAAPLPPVYLRFDEDEEEWSAGALESPIFWGILGGVAAVAATVVVVLVVTEPPTEPFPSDLGQIRLGASR